LRCAVVVREPPTIDNLAAASGGCVLTSLARQLLADLAQEPSIGRALPDVADAL
jgi:hypothetical protein